MVDAMWSYFVKPPLWKKVLGAFLLGASFGLVIEPESTRVFQIVGGGYIDLVRMVAMPLILLRVIHAVGDLHLYGFSWQKKAFRWFSISALFAVVVSFAASFFVLAIWDKWPEAHFESPRVSTSLSDMMLNLIPVDVISSLAQGRILHILFLAFLTGAALASLGEQARRVRLVVEELHSLALRVARFIFHLTPLGTFALVVALVSANGTDRLVTIVLFVVAMYLACGTHTLIDYGLVSIANRLNPFKFFKAAWPAMRMAFISSSSYATIPESMKSSVRLGVSPARAETTLPLMATVKMDACGAIFPVVSAMFAAQFYGIALSAPQLALIAATAVFGSFFTVSIPAAAIAMVSVTLEIVGLPVEMIGYIVAVDQVVDMVRTMTNVSGQILMSVILDRTAPTSVPSTP